MSKLKAGKIGKVSIVMGSASDREEMEPSWKILEELGVRYEVRVLSAHRSPDATAEYAKSARKRGIVVIIAGAGGAAHLAGTIAAHTTLPVIGVPVPSSPLKGFDSLLSTVQMPPGIPVATVGVGKSGAANAGLLATRILALSDPGLKKALDAHRRRQVNKVRKMDEQIRKSIKK